MQALFSPWHHFFLEGCHTRYGNPAGCNLGAAHCITIKYNAWVVAIVLQLNTWQTDIICITIEYESDWLQLYYNRIHVKVNACISNTLPWKTQSKVQTSGTMDSFSFLQLPTRNPTNAMSCHKDFSLHEFQFFSY